MNAKPIERLLDSFTPSKNAAPQTVLMDFVQGKDRVGKPFDDIQGFRNFCKLMTAPSGEQGSDRIVLGGKEYTFSVSKTKENELTVKLKSTSWGGKAVEFPVEKDLLEARLATCFIELQASDPHSPDLRSIPLPSEAAMQVLACGHSLKGFTVTGDFTKQDHAYIPKTNDLKGVKFKNVVLNEKWTATSNIVLDDQVKFTPVGETAFENVHYTPGFLKNLNSGHEFKYQRALISAATIVLTEQESTDPQFDGHSKIIVRNEKLDSAQIDQLEKIGCAVIGGRLECAQNYTCDQLRVVAELKVNVTGSKVAADPETMTATDFGLVSRLGVDLPALASGRKWITSPERSLRLKHGQDVPADLIVLGYNKALNPDNAVKLLEQGHSLEGFVLYGDFSKLPGSYQPKASDLQGVVFDYVTLNDIWFQAAKESGVVFDSHFTLAGTIGKDDTGNINTAIFEGARYTRGFWDANLAFFTLPDNKRCKSMLETASTMIVTAEDAKDSAIELNTKIIVHGKKLDSEVRTALENAGLKLVDNRLVAGQLVMPEVAIALLKNNVPLDGLVLTGDFSAVTDEDYRPAPGALNGVLFKSVILNEVWFDAAAESGVIFDDNVELKSAASYNFTDKIKYRPGFMEGYGWLTYPQQSQRNERSVLVLTKSELDAGDYSARKKVLLQDREIDSDKKSLLVKSGFQFLGNHMLVEQNLTMKQIKLAVELGADVSGSTFYPRYLEAGLSREQFTMLKEKGLVLPNLSPALGQKLA